MGGSLSAFAKPPVRVNMYGVVYDGSGGNYAWHQVQVTPVQNNIFGLTSPDPTVNIVTQIAFYFRIETDSFTSFSLSLKKLSTSLQDNTSITLNNVDIACYSQIGPNSGYYSLQNKTQTTRTVNSDGTTDYNWTFISQTGAISGKPFIKVIIPFQSFTISTTPFYFEMTHFYVDGESAVLSYSDEQLTQINETIQDDSTYYQPSTDIPSPDASHIGDGGSFASSALNEKLGLFDLSGAVQRTLVPIGTYLFTPNSFGDSSSGHTAIVAISTISMALVVIVWIINSLHRSRGWIE